MYYLSTFKTRFEKEIDKNPFIKGDNRLRGGHTTDLKNYLAILGTDEEGLNSGKGFTRWSNRNRAKRNYERSEIDNYNQLQKKLAKNRKVIQSNTLSSDDREKYSKSLRKTLQPSSDKPLTPQQKRYRRSKQAKPAASKSRIKRQQRLAEAIKRNKTKMDVKEVTSDLWEGSYRNPKSGALVHIPKTTSVDPKVVNTSSSTSFPKSKIKLNTKLLYKVGGTALAGAGAYGIYRYLKNRQNNKKK